MKWIPFANSLCFYLTYLVLVNQPKFYYWLLLFLILINFFSALIIQKKALLKGWFNLAWLPLLLHFSTLAAVSLMTTNHWRLLFIFLTLFFSTLYWLEAYYFFNQPKRYLVFSLENLSYYLSLYIIFFIAFAFYGWQDIIALPLFYFLIGAAILTAIVIYQLFWSAKLKFSIYWRNILVAWLVVYEIFIVLSYLPLDYLVLAFILTINYYLAISIIIDKLTHQLNKKNIRWRLLVSVFLISIVFLTARWI